MLLSLPVTDRRLFPLQEWKRRKADGTADSVKCQLSRQRWPQGKRGAADRRVGTVQVDRGAESASGGADVSGSVHGDHLTTVLLVPRLQSDTLLSGSS